MLLEDIWYESTLLGFDLATELNLVHCPVLAWQVAQEGSSQQLANLISQVVSLLLDTQPIIIPEGQFIGRQFQIDDDIHLQAFLLPEVCDLPFGFHWPTTLLALPTFFARKSHQHFNSILHALQSQLEPWFAAVSDAQVLFLPIS
jgi:hypothetical protein